MTISAASADGKLRNNFNQTEEVNSRAGPPYFLCPSLILLCSEKIAKHI